MEIITKEIWLCGSCGNYRGSVQEKYNGKVPVHCGCTIGNRSRDPSMICPNGKFFWTPISYHKEADGKTWSTPYFAPVEPLNKINKK